MLDGEGGGKPSNPPLEIGFQTQLFRPYSAITENSLSQRSLLYEKIDPYTCFYFPLINPKINPILEKFRGREKSSLVPIKPFCTAISMFPFAWQDFRKSVEV